MKLFLQIEFEPVLSGNDFRRATSEFFSQLPFFQTPFQMLQIIVRRDFAGHQNQVRAGCQCK
jgi:hypothetical protein